MRIIRLLGSLFLIPLYLFSLIVPRNSNIWIFGSWFGKRYSDGSRYVFEYIINNDSNIRPIWLTRDKKILKTLQRNGYEVYYTRSLKGYWYTCRASAAIFTVNITDINTLGASKLLKFQLWHGIPLKKIVYDDHYSTESQKKRNQLLYKIKSALLPFKDVYDKWDAVASTSPLVSDIFKSAFKLESNQVFITGTPRADIILNKSLIEPKILTSNYNIKKRIGYFPTHRTNAQPLSDFINSINSSKLLEFLEEQEAVLYIKMHYYNLKSHQHLVSCPRIVLLQEDKASDINYLLPWMDVLITDYSSVYYDYLLLDRPIVFTPFDLSDYMSSDRELYFDYASVAPGPKCNSWDEVAQQLELIFSGKDEYRSIRSTLKIQFHTFSDTNNSLRIVKTIKSLLKKQ